MRELAEFDRLGIGELTADSRQVQPGVAFAAFPGERLDGRSYIAQAIAHGASAVLWEMENFAWNSGWRVPNMGVPGLRSKISAIAGHMYGDPSQKLQVIGVTGTNGKTSCTHWIAQALAVLDRKTAVIGTLGEGFPPQFTSGPNTTPDPIALQRSMARFLAQGAEAIAMEVSSHGLAQGRVNGIAFDVALFTNLSRDHLDYHGDMESYAAAKSTLFDWPSLKHAILNLDDRFGAALAAKLKKRELPVLGYGFDKDLGLDAIRARNLQIGANGIVMDVDTPWGAVQLRSRVLGRFNAANLLGVLGTLLVNDASPEDAARALAAVEPVIGRMQRLGGAGQPIVIVDYAHTPDALEKALTAAREMLASDGRLYCVFGCGGERDQGKRPLMGEAASRLADFVIITSDNPRFESPMDIIAAIAAGARAPNFEVIEKRALAIHKAVAAARPWDAVVIAGKGHETYQEANGARVPFDDVDVARRALGSRTSA